MYWKLQTKDKSLFFGNHIFWVFYTIWKYFKYMQSNRVKVNLFYLGVPADNKNG